MSSPQVIQPEEIDAWLAGDGRRAVWFHSPCDLPARFSMVAWSALPAALREAVPLRMVLIDEVPSGPWGDFCQRWGLRHQSELTVWESGELVWRGVPYAGPGHKWEPWLRQWHLLPGGRAVSAGFTLCAGQWLAMEAWLRGAADQPQCSPVRIEEVIPQATGRGELRLRFFHAAYPEGVQEKEYLVRVLHRGRDTLTLLRLDAPEMEMVLILFAIEPHWMRLHFPGISLPTVGR